MTPLWLDYAQPTPPDPSRKLFFALLTVSILTTVGVHVWINQTSAATDRAIAMARETLSRAADETATTPRADPANEGISPPRFRALLDALEPTLDDTVTIVSMVPRHDELELIGEAKNQAAVTAFVKRLQGIPALSTLHLTETHLVAEHPQHPVRFTVQAQWKAPAP